MKLLLSLFGLVGLGSAQSVKFGKYESAQDVTQHLRIDLDVEAFSAATGQVLNETTDMRNFEEALKIYEEGRFSSKGEGVMRTLQGFSTGLGAKAATFNAENLLMEFPLFVNYYNGNSEYADLFVVNALNGTGDMTDLTMEARSQLAKKGVQYQVVAMYVLYELYSALQSCKKGTVKAVAWDEGAAFYAGSLIGAEGENGLNGQLHYTLAEKRCGSFQTCANGRAQANNIAMEIFDKGKQAVADMDCSTMENYIFQIRKQMQIPLIQGYLQYAYKSDNNQGNFKDMAEAWAFAAGVLPFLDEKDSASAAIIRSNMELKTGVNQTVQDGYEAVFQATYEILPQLCISCEEIGANNFTGAPLCTTGAQYFSEGCAPLRYTTTGDDDGSNDEPTNVGLIVGLCVVAVVLIAAMVALMVYMNKAAKKAQQPKAVQDEGEKPSAATSNNNQSINQV